MYINGTVKGHAAAAESSAAAEDGGDEQRRRRHLAAALQALQHAIEGHPRLAMLMASRPALAPLLEVVERPCRCAPASSGIPAVPTSRPGRALYIYIHPDPKSDPKIQDDPGWHTYTCLHRRLHEVAMPTGALEPPEETMAGEQAAHEAETAVLALAVLVRLTAHAGRSFTSVTLAGFMFELLHCSLHRVKQALGLVQAPTSSNRQIVQLISHSSATSAAQGVWKRWQSPVRCGMPSGRCTARRQRRRLAWLCGTQNALPLGICVHLSKCRLH